MNNKNRVLIVEDDPECVDGLRALLEGKNIFVHIATSCTEAREALLANEYDCVLMDIRLRAGPADATIVHAGGVDLLKDLKHGGLGEKNKGARVVVVTGYPELEIESLVKTLGAKFFYTKPHNDWSTAKAIEQELGIITPGDTNGP